MAIEKFIRGVIDGHRHAGKHSERMRKEAKPLPDGNSLCYLGENDGHFQAEIDKIPQDEEIVLFEVEPPSRLNNGEAVLSS